MNEDIRERNLCLRREAQARSSRFIDTVFLLLQDLGFVIDLKKSVMTHSQEMEFLGFLINSMEMTISLPEEKLQNVKLECLDFHQSPQVSILQLTKVL